MTKPCPTCTAPNPPEAAFCQNCASPFPAVPAQPPPVVGQQPGSHRPAPVVGVPAHAPAAASSGYGQRALIALLLAIFALLCCGPFTGVPAAIVGWLELDAIRNGRSPEGGRMMAQVGLWLGIAASIIHIVLAFFMFALGLMSAGGDPYGYGY
jgi:hypothetical protein